MEEATDLTREQFDALAKRHPPITFQLSREDHKALLHASSATPDYIAPSRVPSRQERVNAEWERVGKAMRFDPKTARPIPGQNARFFTAVPLDSPAERLASAKAKKREELVVKRAQLYEGIRGAEKAIAKIDRELEALR